MPSLLRDPFPACSSPTMMGSGSLESSVAFSVPLDAETAKRPVVDPISELRYLSARKVIVWKEMNKLGREICMLKNEYSRLEAREQLAAEMVEASPVQLPPCPSSPFFFLLGRGLIAPLASGNFRV